MTRRTASTWARILRDSIVRCLLLGKRMLALAIKDDLDACEATGKQMRSDDVEGKERNRMEYNLLMVHLKWIQREGTNNLRLRKSCGLLRRITLYMLIKVGESAARLPNLLKQSARGRRKADGGIRLCDSVLGRITPLVW